MSSTRRAKDSTVFHQSRYSSSPAFERGLIANLVAKRCELLDDRADRELIWFIQYLSHKDGGLKALALDLISKYPDRIQTPAMAQIGMTPGKECSPEQVKTLRESLPGPSFPLRGEIVSYDFGGYHFCTKNCTGSFCDWNMRREEEAEKTPTSYSADAFVKYVQEAAEADLENHLRDLCLNPELNLNELRKQRGPLAAMEALRKQRERRVKSPGGINKLEDGPWYFPSLFSTLREFRDQFAASKRDGVFTTALGQKVCEVLDYTAYSRGLTLMEGDARLGKSFAARAWCDQHPGTARFVEVPSGSDDSSFFRDMACSLGLGNFLNYKVVQIRERVESVLRTGNLLLVLDEAQRLWPQTNPRESFPKRIVWVMTMANKGVPICMISTPQFLATQQAFEKRGWNSAQLTGRIGHYEPLPVNLSSEDLMAVAKKVLPEANPMVLRALAVYALSSARYLAAIDSISTRARYIAMRSGRNAATTEDVRKAMQESVIPADTKLQHALQTGKPGRIASTPMASEASSGPLQGATNAPMQTASVNPECNSESEERPSGSRITQTNMQARIRLPEASLIGV
jgi:hypothetical protein